MFFTLFLTKLAVSEEGEAQTDDALENFFYPNATESGFKYWENNQIPVLNGKNDTRRCYLAENISNGRCLSWNNFKIPYISPNENEDENSAGRNYKEATSIVSYLTTTGLHLNSSCGVEKVTFGLQNKDSAIADLCPMYKNNETCCIPQQSTYESYASVIKNAQQSRRTRIYPKCDQHIRFFPCIMCHPNVKYMAVETSIETSKKATKPQFYDHFYNLRVCHSFAQKLYKDCRYAVSTNDAKYGYGWIVEPNMGYTDFLKKLGIDQLNDNNATLGNTTDIPGVNCWDYSAGHISSVASIVLVALIGTASIAAAFI